jgi:hypothetical protein
VRTPIVSAEYRIAESSDKVSPSKASTGRVWAEILPTDTSGSFPITLERSLGDKKIRSCPSHRVVRVP